MGKILDGLRILIVEDEALLAMELEEAILDLGAAVVGPFGRLRPAMAAADAEKLDGAVLDVRLDGEMIYDLADKLIGMGVPVVLATGSERAHLPEHLQDVPMLQKPYGPSDLQGAVQHILQASLERSGAAPGQSPSAPVAAPS